MEDDGKEAKYQATLGRKANDVSNDTYPDGDRDALSSHIMELFKHRPQHMRELGFSRYELKTFEFLCRNNGHLGACLAMGSLN